MMGGEGRQPSGKDCSPHRGSMNKGQTACVPQKSGASNQTLQANQVRICHNLPQTISDTSSSVARGEQMQLSQWRLGITVNMTYYPNSHFSRERAQPDIAEKLTFWWLKQKVVYLLTSQEVQRGQPRDRQWLNPCCSFPSSPISILAFVFMLVMPSCHNKSLQTPKPIQASGSHSRWKVVYTEERE